MKIDSAQVINLGPPEGKLYGLKDQLIVPSQSIVSVVRPQIVTINNTLLKRLKKAPTDVFNISPRQFEEVIAELLTGMGMDVELTPETRDGGKDILAYTKTELGQLLTLVETKQFRKTHPVGVSLVRSLFGTVVDHGASTGMLVTTSRFAKPAKQFQERHKYHLSLKDYEDVVSWILKHKEFG
jgi:HJR/Mrr/RecB family endonuclease